MSDNFIWCDITELFLNPVRTGIQRVAREVLKRWSGARPLRLCRFDQTVGNLVEVPAAALVYLIGTSTQTQAMSVAEVASALAALIYHEPTVEVPLGARLLIPEVFFDDRRCRHHLWREENAPGQLRMLMFDFIPWIAPDLIGVDRGGALMWYVRLAQVARRPAFISAKTADDWSRRIIRDVNRENTVLPLGADGLDVPRQTFSSSRRTFVALGSVDGRKNQMSIVDAFEHLWAEGLDFGFTLIGSVFSHEQATGQQLRVLASNQPLFSFVEHATDQDIAEVFSQARATIYASKMEGYGLPPVESIACGVPCLVDRNVPSIASLKEGVVQLESLDAEGIARAVKIMTNDHLAEDVWRETATADLPTWQEFGRAVSVWTESD